MYEIHEAANAFPMMTDAEIKDLAEDIKRNGQRVPITLYQGQVLDGRNRLKACQMAGVQPRTVEYQMYHMDDDPYMWVWSLNAERRHLTSQEQKALIWRKLHGMSEAVQKERDRIKAEADKARAEAAKEQSRDSSGLFGAGSCPDRTTTRGVKEAKTRAFEAQAAGVSKTAIARAAALENKAPDLAEKVARGELRFSDAHKEARRKELAEQRESIAAKAIGIQPSQRFEIKHCDFREYKSAEKFDAIITDPPYPKEYLHLYEGLAQEACSLLKPGGVLVAMAGQSYLDQIYEMMSRHMRYYWTACYLTPGQPKPLRQVNVNTTWKPLLVYVNTGDDYRGKIFGDVCVSDKNEKEHHKWGQSVSGMREVVRRFCLPGHRVFDPFCGAGTTGIACLEHGCFFVGCDIDETNAQISTARCNEVE